MIDFDKMLSISESLNDSYISYAQFFVLGKLSTTDQLFVSEIEELLSCSRATTVGSLDRLAKLNLVTRRHFGDSRSIAVEITDSGRRVVQKINAELDEYSNE